MDMSALFVMYSLISYMFINVTHVYKSFELSKNVIQSIS